MRDFILKLLFLIIPLGFFIGGIWLVIQGAQFWLDATLPSEKVVYSLQFSQNSPVTVKVFLPKVIRYQNSPITIDVEVKRKPNFYQMRSM